MVTEDTPQARIEQNQKNAALVLNEQKKQKTSAERIQNIQKLSIDETKKNKDMSWNELDVNKIKTPVATENTQVKEKQAENKTQIQTQNDAVECTESQQNARTDIDATKKGHIELNQDKARIMDDVDKKIDETIPTGNHDVHLDSNHMITKQKQQDATETQVDVDQKNQLDGKDAASLLQETITEKITLSSYFGDCSSDEDEKEAKMDIGSPNKNTNAQNAILIKKRACKRPRKRMKFSNVNAKNENPTEILKKGNNEESEILKLGDIEEPEILDMENIGEPEILNIENNEDAESLDLLFSDIANDFEGFGQGDLSEMNGMMEEPLDFTNDDMKMDIDLITGMTVTKDNDVDKMLLEKADNHEFKAIGDAASGEAQSLEENIKDEPKLVSSSTITESVQELDKVNANIATDVLPKPRPQSEIDNKSFWEKVQAQSEARKKLSTDARFYEAVSPLDKVENLKVTLTVVLNPMGYSTLVNSMVNSKPLGPFPYDRHSRHFLFCIEFGLIPPAEHLPAKIFCHFYEGCLICVIKDNRKEQCRPQISKILLRPDFVTIVQDSEAIFRKAVEEQPELDNIESENLFFEVEKTILLKTQRTLDLHPAFDLVSFNKTLVESPNRFQLSKRKNLVVTPLDKTMSDTVPPGPNSFALLLLAGADRQLRTHCKRYPNRSINHAKPYGKILVQPDEETTIGNPPQQMFPDLLSKMTSPPTQEKIRSMRLVYPTPNSGAPTAEGSTAPYFNKPFYVLDIMRRTGKGCEGVIWRGHVGDRNADMSRISLGNIENANRFADQFRRLARSEGYAVVNDTNINGTNIRPQGAPKTGVGQDPNINSQNPTPRPAGEDPTSNLSAPSGGQLGQPLQNQPIVMTNRGVSNAMINRQQQFQHNLQQHLQHNHPPPIQRQGPPPNAIQQQQHKLMQMQAQHNHNHNMVNSGNPAEMNLPPSLGIRTGGSGTDQHGRINPPTSTVPGGAGGGGGSGGPVKSPTGKQATPKGGTSKFTAPSGGFANKPLMSPSGNSRLDAMSPKLNNMAQGGATMPTRLNSWQAGMGPTRTPQSQTARGGGVGGGVMNRGGFKAETPNMMARGAVQVRKNAGVGGKGQCNTGNGGGLPSTKTPPTPQTQSAPPPQPSQH